MKPLQLKALVFALSLLPLIFYVFGIMTDNLGANPIEAVTRGLGTWALNFLLMTLTATPLKRHAHWTWPLLIRRMLGLFAFFYASLHLLSYLWFDQFFDWPSIIKDIFKRPFITVGMATFLVLCPMAITSSNGAIRRLGLPRWKKLHRLAYLAGILAVLHYFWMVKADTRVPLVYAIGLTLLLGLRAAWFSHRYWQSNHAEK